jgi:hypothetical protein
MSKVLIYCAGLFAEFFKGFAEGFNETMAIYKEEIR